MTLPVYIDIDGTLTDKPGREGVAHKKRVAVVKDMISKGQPVVIWSAAGTKYAQEFAKLNDIDATAAIGKPAYCIDDMKTIKWNGLKIRTPGFLDVLGILNTAGKR